MYVVDARIHKYFSDQFVYLDKTGQVKIATRKSNPDIDLTS